MEPAPSTLGRVAGGDLGALADLYETHAPLAYRLAFRITGSIADAQDVVQDLFIALPEAIASYRGEGRFSAWFRTCAARQSLLHLRKGRRRQEVDLEQDRVSADASASSALDRIMLERALQRLPETLRVVVVLRDIEGFSHEEVGQLVGITAAASRMRLMRARRKLRELVGPKGGRRK